MRCPSAATLTADGSELIGEAMVEDGRAALGGLAGAAGCQRYRFVLFGARSFYVTR